MVPNRISVPLDDKNGDGRAEQKVMKGSAKLSVSYARSTAPDRLQFLAPTNLAKKKLKASSAHNRRQNPSLG